MKGEGKKPEMRPTNKEAGGQCEEKNSETKKTEVHRHAARKKEKQGHKGSANMTYEQSQHCLKEKKNWMASDEITKFAGGGRVVGQPQRKRGGGGGGGLKGEEQALDVNRDKWARNTDHDSSRHANRRNEITPSQSSIRKCRNGLSKKGKEKYSPGKSDKYLLD